MFVIFFLTDVRLAKFDTFDISIGAAGVALLNRAAAFNTLSRDRSLLAFTVILHS